MCSTLRHALLPTAALAVAAAFVVGVARAAPADLDPAFDGDGMLTTAFATQASAFSTAILANGKIVAAGGAGFGTGAANFALARYLPDGTPDPIFDGDGKVETDFGGFDYANAVAVQNNGKLVAAGVGASSNVLLARYKRDGNPDVSFDGDGRVVTDFGPGPEEADDLAIQSDGKLVIAGTAGTPAMFALARYTTNGKLDASFGSGGKVTTDFGADAVAQAVAVQADGKIIAAGRVRSGGAGDFALARYNPNGTLDTTFDGDGRVVTDIAGGDDAIWDVALQPDSMIVAAGSSSTAGDSDFALARYAPDGSLDTGITDPFLDSPFGVGGIVTTDLGSTSDRATSVAVETNGQIVAAGVTQGTDADFALARYSPGGSLDPDFGTGGTLTSDFGADDGIEGLVLQRDGKIVVAGASGTSFALARYLGDPVIPFGTRPAGP